MLVPGGGADPRRPSRWAHGIEPGDPGSAFRSVDILPTVLRTMGIPLTHRVDGRAYRLELDR